LGAGYPHVLRLLVNFTHKSVMAAASDIPMPVLCARRNMYVERQNFLRDVHIERSQVDVHRQYVRRCVNLRQVEILV